MKIVIEAEPKEIAALISQLQERQGSVLRKNVPKIKIDPTASCDMPATSASLSQN